MGATAASPFVAARSYARARRRRWACASVGARSAGVGEERTPGREEVTDARGRDWQESIVGMLGSAWSCAWVDFRCEPGSPAALAFAVDRTREILTVVLGAWSETFGDRDLVLALQALQDLGEGYALLTQSWPIGTEVAPSIPDRRI